MSCTGVWLFWEIIQSSQFKMKYIEILIQFKHDINIKYVRKFYFKMMELVKNKIIAELKT